jgi:YhcH/YjgK/YiaL family protein
MEDGIFECFNYAKENNLSAYDRGCHEIDAKRIFVNIVEYETVKPEDRFWEAHREYLDVHLMLEGTERIDLNFIQNMDVKEYAAKDDFLSMDGEKNASVILKPGDFLVCYPTDAHRTAVAADKQENIKKAIFKVKI